MIVNATACDWLTLTFNLVEDEKKARAIRDAMLNGERAGDKQRMQYKGDILGNCFVGSGIQRGKAHHMLQVSGDDADMMAGTLAGIVHGTCTRLDMQYTISLPESYCAREVYDFLEAETALGVTLIQNEDGMDTVYVGSRKSARFWRIYVKEDVDGTRWLRLEIECKRHVSRRYWHEITIGAESLITCFASECGRMHTRTDGNLPYLADFFGKMAVGEILQTPEEKGERNIIRWLNRVVGPAIQRASHSQREQIREWLEQMVGWMGGEVRWEKT